MAFQKDKVLERAEKFAAKGQHDKAAKEYQIIVDADPKDVRSGLMLADCLVRCGDKVRAIERYLIVAGFYADSKQAQKAIAVYRQVLSLDASRIDVHANMGRMLRELGRVQDAVGSYETIGRMQLESGNVSQAIETMKLITDLEPTSVSRRLRLAELYSRERAFGEAVEQFRIAADQLFAAGRLEDYVRVAERLVYHKPDEWDVVRSLAQTYLRLQDPRRALMKLNALMHANPDDVRALELLAETFVALGKVDKAVSVIGELARSLEGKGDTGRAQAVRVLRRALEWQPSNASVRQALDKLTSLDDVAKQEIAGKEPSAVELELDEGGVEEEIEELHTGEVELEEADAGEESLGEQSGSRPHERSLTDDVLSEVQRGHVAPEEQSDLDKMLVETRVYMKYRLFEHALEHLSSFEPNHVGALGLRARALTELDRKDEAADVYVRLAQLSRDNDPKLAQEYLNAALTCVPNHWVATRLLAALSSAGAAKIRAQENNDSLPANASPIASTREIEAAYDPDDSGFGIVSEDEDTHIAGTPGRMQERSDDDQGPGHPERADNGAGRVSNDQAIEIDRASAHTSAQRRSPEKDDAEFSIEVHEPDSELDDESTHQITIEDRFGLSDDEPEPEPSEAQPQGADAAQDGQWPDISSDLAEIRFFVSQGLEDDANVAFGELEARWPDHPDVRALEREFSRGTAVTVDTVSGSTPISVEELEPDVGEHMPQGVATHGAIGKHDDDEENAYLSAIFSEGSTKRAPSGQAKARAQVDDADAGTHFDLATAYREMGLVEEAIGAFETAARDPRWRARALVSMAALVVHRGDTDTAIGMLQDAIDNAKTPDELFQAKYELGLLYEKLGNSDAAIEQYQDIDPSFRDRDKRLASLKEG